jgi:hypothetical protein
MALWCQMISILGLGSAVRCQSSAMNSANTKDIVPVGRILVWKSLENIAGRARSKPYDAGPRILRVFLYTKERLGSRPFQVQFNSHRSPGRLESEYCRSMEGLRKAGMDVDDQPTVAAIFPSNESYQDVVLAIWVTAGQRQSCDASFVFYADDGRSSDLEQALDQC